MTALGHDWTLVRVGMDWRDRKAIIQFRSHEGEQAIEISGVSDLRIPCREPWGPSSQVNGIEIRRDRLVHLSVEMQSGDVILVTGSGVALPDHTAEE